MPRDPVGQVEHRGGEAPAVARPQGEQAERHTPGDHRPAQHALLPEVRHRRSEVVPPRIFHHPVGVSHGPGEALPLFEGLDDTPLGQARDQGAGDPLEDGGERFVER